MAAHVAQGRFVEAGGFGQLHGAQLIGAPLAMGEGQAQELLLVAEQTAIEAPVGR
jgi:hypothetical protein